MRKRKIAVTDRDTPIAELARTTDHRALAIWAADCAERVLAYFEERCPEDPRPRRAIDACREWARTGVFRMADVRGTSLAAHAAARDVQEGTAAHSAARAAGQALATAHVPAHALAAALYAATAVRDAATAAAAAAATAAERAWQLQHLRDVREGRQASRAPRGLGYTDGGAETQGEEQAR